MANITDKTTPMMRHYRETKQKYPEAILFYRLGDFYEMFDEDAKICSKVLDLTLTGKDCGEQQRAPMCGVPFHAAENYIGKLVRRGYKVAICEQLSVPVANERVERDVVRVVTPGTVTDASMLEENRNNFILCANRTKNGLGVAYADISTGDFFTAEYQTDAFSRLNDIIAEIDPAEIICNQPAYDTLCNLPVMRIMNVPKPEVYLEKSFVHDNATYSIKNHFGVTALAVFELSDHPLATVACGALLDYLFETQKIALQQIRAIKKLNISKHMVIDTVARKNLELVDTIRGNKQVGTLFSVLDQTKTAMGARQLRLWLEMPLCDDEEINLRLDGVEELYKNLILRENLATLLKSMHDIERQTAKIGMGSIMPRECNALKNSLELLPNLKNLLKNVESQKLKLVCQNIADLGKICNLIGSVIQDEPAVHLKDGGYIRAGFNAELDHFNALHHDAANAITALEASERARTGLDTLRIRFNRVYGYYIELGRQFSDRVPFDYHRKQTVANFDRYFTETLKNLENEITASEENSKKLELKIFAALREELLEYIDLLQQTSKAIAELDALISLATVASKNNYVRPIISKKVKQIMIEDGRHPVVEANLKSSEFIPNSTLLNSADDKVLIITGPNMAGKSTYMRQVAIITLMAHIGSFVPAKHAEISITDRIFTRVGASDDLASGQSTFMVEMTEMANILQNATDKSLIVLDEIGRGTSTFDGLSLAWAIVEHFSAHKSKVLFATHYHELTELEGLIGGVKNYQISVKEQNNSIVFLRKIIRGGASRSFGIEVASMAGIPQEIIARAKQVSHNIEQENINIKLANMGAKDCQQETLDTANHNNQVVCKLKDLNINKISPLEAFEILQQTIKELI